MRLSPIFTRYVGRHFFSAFIAVVGVIMGLVLLFDMIELLRRASARDDANFTTVVTMALLKLPQMMHTILPFAVMLGAMISFWRLTRTHELVVARAAGVSVWQVLFPVLALALAVGVVNITVFNPFAAAMYSRYERLQDSMLLRRDNPLMVGEGGLWLRETSDGYQAVVHANHVRQDGFTLSLRDVSIFVLDSRDRFDHRIDAATARLDDGYFNLDKVWVMRPGRASEAFPTFRLKTALTVSKIQDNFSSPEALSFWELPGFIKFFENAGFAATHQRLYFQSLLASPLLLCAMVLIAAPFSLKPNMRSGGLMWRISGGVVAGFVFYFFSKVTYAVGLSNTLPLGLAAWSPALVASCVGLAALFHLEDG